MIPSPGPPPGKPLTGPSHSLSRFPRRRAAGNASPGRSTSAGARQADLSGVNTVERGDCSGPWGRTRCSLVLFNAPVRKGGAASRRHFLGLGRFANVDVAGSNPVSCSSFSERPRSLRPGAFSFGAGPTLPCGDPLGGKPCHARVRDVQPLQPAARQRADAAEAVAEAVTPESPSR